MLGQCVQVCVQYQGSSQVCNDFYFIFPPSPNANIRVPQSFMPYLLRPTMMMPNNKTIPIWQDVASDVTQLPNTSELLAIM
jgi:hypothetical protein